MPGYPLLISLLFKKVCVLFAETKCAGHLKVGSKRTSIRKRTNVIIVSNKNHTFCTNKYSTLFTMPANGQKRKLKETASPFTRDRTRYYSTHISQFIMWCHHSSEGLSNLANLFFFFMKLEGIIPNLANLLTNRLLFLFRLN
jgi:hypothetical protein